MKQQARRWMDMALRHLGLRAVVFVRVFFIFSSHR